MSPDDRLRTSESKGPFKGPLLSLAEEKLYSTVTLFARFLGWSISQPRILAMW